MKAWQFKWILRLYPSYLGPGIKVKRITDDFRRIEVELKLNWRSRNVYGTHFGGNLYSMVDPFYVLMFLNNLEKEYMIWDKEARIRFISPGTSKVKAVFRIDDSDLEKVRKHTQNGDIYTPVYIVEITDSSDNIVAIVEKTLYFKRKQNE